MKIGNRSTKQTGTISYVILSPTAGQNMKGGILMNNTVTARQIGERDILANNTAMNNLTDWAGGIQLLNARLKIFKFSSR